MAISYVSSASGINAATGTTVTIPATVQTGDRLVVLVESNNVTGYSHITPDGWTLVDTWTGASGAAGGSTIGSVFTKSAGTSDSGTTVLFGVTPTGSTNICVLSAYRGTITTPQVMEHALLPFSGTATTTVPVPVLTLTSSEVPATLVTGVYRKSGSGVYTTTPPAGFTQRNTCTAPGNVVSIADGSTSTSGSTSVGTWDGGVSTAAGGSFLIALVEGAVPMQAQPTFRRYTVSGWYPAVS